MFDTEIREIDKTQLEAMLENAPAVVRFVSRTGWQALVESIAVFVVKFV